MSLKIELHLHTSRYSPCARATPEEMLTRLVQTGYDAVYVTEHDAVWSDLELARLQPAFPEIRVLPGVEISMYPHTSEVMQHLLVLGTNDPGYLDLAEQPAELLARARQAGCLTVLAHPFRWPGGAQILADGIVPDALEAFTGNHEASGAHQAVLVARGLEIPTVNAGDVHALDFIDRYWIETDEPLVEAKDIRRIVIEGLFRNVTRGQRD